MRTSDLDFSYPAELIAREPSRPTRVAWVDGQNQPDELTLTGLLEKFRSGDLLVVNESRVIPARVFAQNEVEILFLKSLAEERWQVLFPARDLKVGDQLKLPEDITLTLIEKGLPQTVQSSVPLTPEYFQKHGEMALPPYIQEARGERHNRDLDTSCYQTAWAREPGSVAAPTASLHFTAEHLRELQAKGVSVEKIVLHVGAGTFLPLKVDEIEKHVMHEEWAVIPHVTLDALVATRARGGRVWALGTTVARTLESQARGLLASTAQGEMGATKLFIYPPFQFQNVDVLLTNFHQPKSTLLALVAAWAGLERVHAVYAWAIARKFRLFSYGDLSAWTKP